MKIVYHIPIMEKLTSAITRANQFNKKIDFFVLNDDEYNEFLRIQHPHKTKSHDGKYRFYDINIVNEEDYDDE